MTQFSSLGDPLAGPENPLAFAVTERDRATLSMVAQAVARKQVLLAYQPVVRATHPTKVAFYEGLIRIMDDTGRIIPARDFIDAVESRELGRQIDCLALEFGLAALAENAGLRLAINMSARSTAYPRWLDTLDAGLKRDVTVGERLILEITESSAMLVPEIVATFMERVQARGVGFALDDFGSGYTAFRYFKDFYFDILKIDGQFIRDIHTNTDNQVLTRALISIAQHFDMFTVAESVENAEDAQFLIEAGVDCLQGYFFGAPTIRPSWQEQPKMRSA